MLLSELQFPQELAIYNEKEFDYLALAVQNPGKKILTFINEKKYLSNLNENVSMVITKSELKDFVPTFCGVVISESPSLTFFKLHNFLEMNIDYNREEYNTVIGQNCRISKLASIAETNVTIGNNVIIEDFVTIYSNTVINDNCIIRSGAKIGGQGFEYKRSADNIILTVNHYGGVIIEHDVDIHCNVCIDRAVYPWDNTVIGEYTKIDNLVHIGHAVKIGKRCLITSGTQIAGRTNIGDNCWFGVGAIVSNGLSIGNNASITIGSVVIGRLDDNEKVSGFYAIKHNDFLLREFKLRKLK